MRRRLERRFWIGVALVAVLAGATAAAVMAAQPASKHARHHSPHSRHAHSRHSDRTSVLAVAAGYLGTTPAEVRGELQSGKSLAEVANATSGKSAQGLIQTLEAAAKKKLHAAATRLSARIVAKVDGHPGDGPAVHAATSYLGLTVTQLRADVRSGKTLAQVASSTSGKSEAGLIEAIVAARKTALATEAKAGRIPQARAATTESRLVSRVTARVRGSHRVLHHSHRGRAHKQ